VRCVLVGEVRFGALSGYTEPLRARLRPACTRNGSARVAALSSNASAGTGDGGVVR